MSSHAEVTFNWAAVGDIGNPADPLNEAGDPDLNIPGLGIPGIGSVAYPYEIATTEVTLAQYAEFLNAVAQTDPHELYNPALGMGLDLNDNEFVLSPNIAGISRSGEEGAYSYAVIGTGTRPVTYVSWNDAARFVNWLHNGQGNGDTESGVYDMSEVAPVRSETATYFLPSLNEWYKAAYYDPSPEGPGGSAYWLYPTRSNDAPGNIVGSSPNNANSIDALNSFFSVTQSSDYDPYQNYLTEVGSFTGSATYYGTYDQAGNVGEWTEYFDSGSRGYRGGSWVRDQSLDYSSSQLYPSDPTYEIDDLGFRVGRAADPFAAWGSENLLGYAIGGAPSPGEAGEAPVVDVASNALRLTAVVRKGDPRLVVAGEAVDSLTGTWSSDGVESTVDGVDQTGLNGTLFERRRFSVPISGTKKFIRLRATFTE